MKKQFLLLLLPALVAGTALTSCQPNEKTLENDQENIREAEKKFADDWNEYKQEQEEKIRKNEEQIVTIRQRMNDANEKDRVIIEQRANELDEKNRAMRARIDDYDREKRREKWEEFKKEFNRDMEELGNALKDLNKDNVK
jgi:DNA repair exonuclease SbcCD ATPase subunit